MSTDGTTKRAAAIAALAELPHDGVIGIGTGSTSHYFIEALAETVRAGRTYACVATSDRSRSYAHELGLRLLDDAGPWDIDVCVDGADEVDADLNLIKGGGGAHLREKIVNNCARKNVIIVDDSKLSRHLGEHWPVPVEVVAFGHLATAHSLARLGTPTLRLREGAPWRTDAGNLIYDVACGVITKPDLLDREVRSIPGVVETGLFIGRADVVLVGSATGTTRLVRAVTVAG